MKKLLCAVMLAAFVTLLSCAALASPLSVGPYALTIPENAACTDNEGSHTVILDATRVVVMAIARVPDESPEDALQLLMHQFDEKAKPVQTLPLADDCLGLLAVTDDKYGEGVDLLTAMVLHEGDLLILAGYDMSGNRAALLDLMEELLRGVTVDGASIMPDLITEVTPA